jgi:4-hydroxybenzoate polyprenyltransferase
MVVNDYYDAKLGRDESKPKALVQGTIALVEAKQFVTWQYACALICLCFLPGAPTRVSVQVGLMMTYLYTQHLKPITWIKNVVCAALIAFAPWTSGSSALYLLREIKGFQPHVWSISSLWRLFFTLFSGVMGREIMMDCNDAEADAATGVKTVPVVYGRRFASAAALLTTVTMSVIACLSPALDWLQLQRKHSFVVLPVASWRRWMRFWTVAPLRRLTFAVLGSAILLRRSWQVFRTKGENPDIINTTVDESLYTIVFMLASFV